MKTKPEAAVEAVELPENLMFWVGDQEYAISLAAVSEVTPAHEPRLVPRMPLELGGIMNVRGEPLPVVEASVLLGHARGERRRHALVFEGAARLGVLVDRVTRIERELGPELTSREVGELVVRWYGTEQHAIGQVDPGALVASAMALLAREEGTGGEQCLDAF